MRDCCRRDDEAVLCEPRDGGPIGRDGCPTSLIVEDVCCIYDSFAVLAVRKAVGPCLASGRAGSLPLVKSAWPPGAIRLILEVTVMVLAMVLVVVLVAVEEAVLAIVLAVDLAREDAVAFSGVGALRFLAAASRAAASLAASLAASSSACWRDCQQPANRSRF